MNILLAIIAGLGDLIGGILPLNARFRNISTRYIIAFASGIVISAAFFELFPEADIKSNWGLVGAGFFVMYLIDKGLALHQCGESECEITGVNWVTIVGMASDNIIDGIGISVAYATSHVLGIVVALAVIAHEIPQGITTTLIMINQQYRLRRMLLILMVAAVMYPIGAGIGSFVPPEVHLAAIAFVAGVFLYTGAAALMTEAHRRFNLRVMLFLMIGAAIALALRFLE